jgi:4-hydroxy-2-oxoheptanedioate aldolase
METTSTRPLNRLRKQLADRRPTFGLIATIPSIQTVQGVVSAGPGWLLV